MFFSDWRMLLRRWYAVLLGLLLTVGLCFGAATLVRPSYEIKAMMLVLPPRSTVGQGGNPFLALGGLGSVADVVSRAIMDGNTVQQLVALGANDDFEVIQDATSSGPVILITSTGGSPAEAEQTLRIVKEQVPVKLLALQQATNVPERSLITVSLLSQDESPVVVRKSQLRAVVVAFAAGIGATLLLTGLLDGLLLRRRRRRLGPEETAAAEPVPTEPVPSRPVPSRPVPSRPPAAEPLLSLPSSSKPGAPGASTAPPTAPIKINRQDDRHRPDVRRDEPRPGGAPAGATVFDLDRLPAVFRESFTIEDDPEDAGDTPKRPPKRGNVG